MGMRICSYTYSRVSEPKIGGGAQKVEKVAREDRRTLAAASTNVIFQELLLLPMSGKVRRTRGSRLTFLPAKSFRLINETQYNTRDSEDFTLSQKARYKLGLLGKEDFFIQFMFRI
jgi:hypothetical protein